MNLNFLFLPTLVGALVLFLLGYQVARVVRSPAATLTWLFLGAVAAVPCLLFVVCYAHLFDNAAWFYSFRAASYSELTASGIGLIAGLAAGLSRRGLAARSSPGQRLFARAVGTLCLGLLFVPYAKPVIAPITRPLRDEWSQGVSLQSSPSTCGPSSAATLLRQFNILVSERDLARECFSYRGGTENWFVARALRRHGLESHYLISSPEPPDLPFPSMAGVQMGGARTGGHFITVLGRQGDRTIIGDPLVGRLVLSPQQLRSRYYFTGFFLIASRPSSRQPLSG